MRKILLVLIFTLSNYLAYSAAQVTQKEWRWRKDDGSETSATWSAPQQGALSKTVCQLNEVQRLRLGFVIAPNSVNSAENSEITVSANLRYATSELGPWTTIPATATNNEHFELATSNIVSSEEATTQQLSSTNQPYTPGRIIDKSTTGNIVFFTPGKTTTYTEYEFVIKPTDKLQGGSTYYFRLDGLYEYANPLAQLAPSSVGGSTVVSNVTCNGLSDGSINLTPSNGTGPYTYDWGGGVTTEDRTGLPAGNYSVTVKDVTGCSGVVEVTVGQPAALTATTSKTDASSFGASDGSASVTVSGGTSAYTYSWKPSGGTAATASGLSAGTYTVTVTDANLCSIQKSVTITQPAASTNATLSNLTLSAGTLTPAFASGTNSYTASVASGVSSVDVMPTAGSSSVVKVNGVTVVSGNAVPVSLNEGNNTVTIAITAQDGVTKQQYSVIVNRKAAPVPAFTSSPVTTASVGTAYTYKVQAGDNDNNTIKYNASVLPSWLQAKEASAVAEFGGTIASPRAIAIDADGTTFAASSYKIYKTSPDGTTTKWIEIGTGGSIDGLAINGGYLYISSSNNSICKISRVKIDNSSAPLESNIITGIPVATRGIAFKDGFLFSAMSDVSKVLRVSLNSDFPIVYSTLLDYITSGLSNPYGMSVSNDGSLMIANYNSKSVVKYNGGMLTTVLTSSVNVTDAREDLSGNVYVSTGSGVSKYVYDSASATYIASDVFTGYVNALSVNASGTIAFGGLFSGKIYKCENSSSIALSGTPEIGDIGEHQVTINASNGAQSKDQSFTITVSGPASLSNFSAINKTYGDESFTLTAPTTNSEGKFTYVSSNPAVASISGSTVTVLKAGTTTITATQEASGLYTETSTTATLTVNKKALTVTAENKSKTYGEANPALSVTYDGLVNNESALNPAPLISTTATALTGVGEYDITASGESANYELTFKKGTLTIKKKALTVTAANKSKTYGDVNPSLSVTYNGLVNNETALEPAPLLSTTATTLSGVGEYDITASGEAANYAVTFEKGTLTVNKKALTVTAANKSKAYGDVNPSLNVVYDGLVNNETALNPAPLVSTTATTLSGVGEYDITASGEAANYAVTFQKGTLTVNKKALTVTVDDKSKTYGDVNPSLSVTYSGLVNGETALNPAPVVSTTATTLSAAGKYDITASGEAANYAVTFEKGTLTIGKKALTVTADNKSKTYGDVNPALSVTYSGLVNGETALNPAPVVATTATALSAAGMYDITASGEAANYAVTFQKGTLTIGKKALTVTADNKSKTYGDVNPSLSVTYSGLVNGETALNPAPVVSTAATALSGAGEYDITASGTAANYELNFQKGTLTVNKKALTVTAENKSKTYGDVNPALSLTYSGLVNGETALSPAPLVSTAATVLSGVGTYDITASGEAANYNVNYVKGTLTVNKKALTITAADKEKFQGLALPVFTANYLGFVNGETSSVLSTQPAFFTIADAMSPQGTYPITVSGATATNYAISFVPGTLTVKPGFPTSITLAAAPVFENAATGALAGTLSSTSDDPSATFTYTLVNGTGDADNASFKIVGNQIQTNAVLNFENKSRYSVLVRSTTQHGLFLDKPLTITIGDVNEQPTLNNIANSTICYTTTAQSVALSGITSGPDADQGTVLSVSTNNNSLFKSLEVNQVSNRSSAVIYTLNEGVSGSAVINVLVTDNGGIENGGLNTIMKSFTLNVNPLPVIAISSTKGTSLSKGEIALLKAELTSAGPAATYSWSNANGILSGQNSSTLEVRPTETTTYTVTVTNANGCSSTETITIEVRADFQVVDGTNIVTPNGDGVNDNFVIRNIDMYPNNVVKIFDRAGRLLYSKTNYGNEWTGTFNGSPLAEDTYYYIVDFGAGKQKIKGFITIVRD